MSDSSESTIFYQKDLFNQGFPMMENIRREGKLCDVNIIVGDHTLQGHRIVLAANIPYFRAMFTHDMAESRQPNITMHSIDPSAAESLINFAYTGRVTISTSNVQNLMMGASFLQLSKVRDACAEFLQVNISDNSDGRTSLSSLSLPRSDCPHRTSSASEHSPRELVASTW